MRAFVDLWDEICRDALRRRPTRSYRRFRYGVQVNSLGLTEQQPENNVYRILIEMLAVVLSKNARARAVQLPAWNEALGLPRPFDQQWSLRMQQIMAYETDLLEYDDLFDGNPAVDGEGRGAEGRRPRRARQDRRDGRRGRRHRLHEVGSSSPPTPPASPASRPAQTIVVGVNRFTEAEPSPLTAGDGGIMVVDPAVEAEQVARLAGLARRPRRRRRRGGPRRARGRGAGRREHHAGLDRRREGRRHHRRVGRRDARGLRRVPRPDRRRQGGRRARRQPRRGPRRGRGGRAPASGGASSSSSASPASTAIPTAPSRSPSAPATAAWRCVYEGIRLTPAQIVNAALEESVHVVGLSILSGSHLPLVTEVHGADARRRPRRHAGGRRRHHPRRRRRDAARRRRRPRLHARRTSS